MRLGVAREAAGSIPTSCTCWLSCRDLPGSGAQGPRAGKAQPKCGSFQGVSWKSPVLDGASLQDSLSLAPIPPSQQQVQKIT